MTDTGPTLRTVARIAATALAIGLAGLATLALVVTWSFSTESNADQLADETSETAAWAILACASLAFAAVAIREATRTSSAFRGLRYTTAVVVAALGLVAWWSFATYLAG